VANRAGEMSQVTDGFKGYDAKKAEDAMIAFCNKHHKKN
jgi:hypothetical protein